MIYLKYRESARKLWKKLKRKLLFSGLFFLLWLARYQSVKPAIIPLGTEVKIKSVLRYEPAFYSQSQVFSLQGIKIKTLRFPEYQYGDYLVALGTTTAYGLEYPQIEVLETGRSASGLRAKLLALRKKIETIYNQVLPEPQASLLAGIVLGSKRQSAGGFQDTLKKTGTMHVVVASGANISLVSQPLLNNLAGFLSRPLALGLAFIFIWFYALLSGFEAPVIRAAIMASISFLAQLLGKEKDVFTSLVIAIVLMLLVNPLFAFDLGFQLSVAATLGILLFQARFQPYFQRLPLIGPDLATTLAAQIFVLPLIAWRFGEFSLLSPLSNALVLWTIDPLMKLGGLLAATGFLSRSLTQLLAYPAWLLLTYFVKVLNQLALINV